MSNYINDIEITNFKSIRHGEIRGCKRINVFIGYPNVGKSNILEALSLGSLFQYEGIEDHFKLTDIVRLEAFNEIFSDGNADMGAEVSIDKGKHVFDIKPDRQFDRLISKYTFKHFDKNPNSNIKLISSAFPLIFNIDRDFSIRSSSLNQFISNLHDNKSLANEEILNELPIIRKYCFSPSVMPDNKRGGKLEFPYGNNLMIVLNEDSQLRKEVAEIFAQYNWTLLFDKSSESIKLFRQYSDNTVFTPSYSLTSDTLQRLIFYKGVIKSNKNTVLLIEEPEAHMFPPYIRKFTSDVIFDKTNQFFIATHSPYVLDEFIEEVPDELSVYLVDYKNGETIIKRLEEEQIKEIRNYGVDLFFNLESYLKNG